MPELPEVETTRRGIAPHIEGHTIKNVIIRHFGLRWPVDPNLAQCITGQTVLSVERRAKYLLLRLEHGTLMIHLGMSGSLRVLFEEQPAGKHDHVDIVFENGAKMRFTDPRRFGSIHWSEVPIEQHALITHLGPEPLTEAFTGEWLYQRSRHRTTAVKTFIMDNKVVVGVGNIYANEALFFAGISPKRHAGLISRERYNKLCACIKTTLAAAIEQGGTTLKDFVNGEGKPGYFQQQLAVYGRTGEPCIVCERPITEIKMGGRTTYYCRNCQR